MIVTVYLCKPTNYSARTNVYSRRHDQGANLDGATLRGADLRNSDLTSCSLRGGNVPVYLVRRIESNETLYGSIDCSASLNGALLDDGTKRNEQLSFSVLLRPPKRTLLIRPAERSDDGRGRLHGRVACRRVVAAHVARPRAAHRDALHRWPRCCFVLLCCWWHFCGCACVSVV
jgi:hypothetical protein